MFQSAPPLRGAMIMPPIQIEWEEFQSAPPLRGAIHFGAGANSEQGVSIRAPLAGSDDVPRAGKRPSRCFNPRPPCGERFSDRIMNCFFNCFNPRPPCGERSGECWELDDYSTFQSAPPLRGAIITVYFFYGSLDVSIRAPLAGSDAQTEGVKLPKWVSIRAPLAGSDSTFCYSFS